MSASTENLIPSSGSPEERKKVLKKRLIFTVGPFIIGTALAFTVYYLGDTETYDARIATVGANDGGWVYLALIIFGKTIFFLNVNTAMKYKTQMKGNTRAEHLVYKLSGENAPAGVNVVIETEGVNGKYNRANRSVHNMVENFGGFVASLYAAGFVFPVPTFICIVCYCFGRVAHQIGYSKGFGKHLPGFAISLISMNFLEGLLLIVGIFGY